MSKPDPASSDRELVPLRRLSLVFLALGAIFLALVFNPLAFGFFGLESESEARVWVEDNLTPLRVLFTALGLCELGLGIALWLWGREVGGRTPGRRGSVAKTLGWAGLLAGALVFPGRLFVWFEDAEAIADDDLGPLELLFGPAFALFSVAIIGFGVLMVLGSMPTWLGASWIVFGVLAWLGILPLWFFVAALTLGITGAMRFRPGHGTPEQVSALRQPPEPSAVTP